MANSGCSIGVTYVTDCLFMKFIILILGLVCSGVADSCGYYAFASQTNQIQGLAYASDSIVWVELLSLKVEYPQLAPIEPDSSSPAASTLEQLLALVKRDQIRRALNPPTISISYNSLHLIQGHPVELNSTCQNCRGFSSTLYNGMTVGKKYILFYKDSNIIGAAEAIETEDYQRIFSVINETRFRPISSNFQKSVN